MCRFSMDGHKFPHEIKELPTTQIVNKSGHTIHTLREDMTRRFGELHKELKGQNHYFNDL